MLVGLTGGMASGKSFVAETFKALGAHIIEADQLGRETLEPGGEAFGPVIEEFGHDILAFDEQTGEGRIDRSRLARKVFSNPAALKRLNAIVHPAVRTRALCHAEHILSKTPDALVVYVAAILIETGGFHDCGKLVVGTCDRETQIERAMARDNASRADIEARLARQLPPEELRKHADYLIDSGGTKEDTARQTKMVFEALAK